MILLLGRNSNFMKDLKQQLNACNMQFMHYPKYSKNSLEQLYSIGTHLAVVEFDFSPLPIAPWVDILSVQGKRIPLVVFKNSIVPEGALHSNELELGEFHYRENPEVAEIFGLVIAHHKDSRALNSKQSLIPDYHQDVPLKILLEEGAVSFLSISGTKLRSIALEYGNEAYLKMQTCFQDILYDLWGSPGSFRREDILMRKSPLSNDYLMFLQRTRTSATIPAPGVTEKLANRIAFRIQTALWEEFLKAEKDRRIPDCLHTIPEISVGYATAINNHCENPESVLEMAIEKSFETAKLQQKRVLDRQREVMQTLIHSPDILYPNYQAVFNLQKISKQDAATAKNEKTIAHLTNQLIGFESLIRVRKERIEPLLRQDGLIYMDSKILRPDILFQIAHSTTISLELDQACLKQALKSSTQLSGKLLINILPRNLYYILSILPLKESKRQIIFEVSESESIQNFDLIMRLSKELKKMNMSIAADDFGKGYAGLERILRIEPELIKLDRALIQNIHQEKIKRSYVKGLVAASQDSNATILAEGVECWEEAEVLQAMGVDLIQGFLLHMPQCTEKILDDLGIDVLDSDEEPIRHPSVA